MRFETKGLFPVVQMCFRISDPRLVTTTGMMSILENGFHGSYFYGEFFLSPFLLREMDMGVIGDLRWWMLDNVKQERIRERSIAQ